MFAFRRWSVCCLGLLLGLAQRAAAFDADLARQAEAVLKAHCYRCHGKEGVAKGGMNYILDRDKLVAREKIVPGRPAESTVYGRVFKGEMPPKAVKPRPSRSDLEILREWIEDGAVAARPAASRHDQLSESHLVDTIFADLQGIELRARPYVRYFTYCNLYNAGVIEDDLETYRQALSKLVNSLSWHPRITRPLPIDPARTIYRIDLRDLQWSAPTWTRILAAYPHYLPVKSETMKRVAAATRTSLPYLRADWFVANASRPPLYHDILQLPLSDRELERQLRVDGALDIREDRVVRAGFNRSGIAKNNRMIERHDAGFGAYWRSYDFSENVGRQNLFEHPLGPQPAPNSFVHAGSEMIFHLPNGLLGYYLVDGNGRRLDRAPVEIVSDPKRPDKLVETGISCISCHVQGIIDKSDEIRAHVEKNSNAFSKEDVATIKALYPPEARFFGLAGEDGERFRKALAKTGVEQGGKEPVLALTLLYEGELDLASAAAEVGLRPREFSAKLALSPQRLRPLGPLNVRGGSVPRQVFLSALPDLLREFQLGDASRPDFDVRASEPPPDRDDRPFAGHRGHILCVALSPDGKRAVSGSEDHTARVWDVASGREIRPLEGHTDEVLAVAFSSDGKQILTGSADRTVRLWDVMSGRELVRMEGHTERVSSVAFSPDGRRALSGGWDQMVRLWDLPTGRVVRRLTRHTSYVTSVAFSGDGGWALTGSQDMSVRLWDLATGRELRCFDGHTKEVYAVALSQDKRFAASGGNDGAVRLWDIEKGKELRVLAEHTGAVVAVAFSADGARVFSGSSQYRGSDKPIRVWETKTGRELHGLDRKTSAVWCLAFSPDGRYALSGGSDKTLDRWQIPE